MNHIETKICDGLSETLDVASPPLGALKPHEGQPPVNGMGARQAGLGNAMVAAAAIGGSPPNSDNISELQSSYGNSALSRAFIQRKPDGEGVSGAETTRAAEPPATDTGQTATGGAAAPVGLIVDDSAGDVAPNQMKRGAFLSQLRSAVRGTVEQTLAGLTMAAAMRPFVDQEVENQFSLYGGLDGRSLESTIRRQVPGAGGATNASALIPSICEQVRRNIIAAAPPERSAVSTVAEAATSAFGSLATTAGSVVSGIGSVLFKADDGGVRRSDNAATLRAQLGDGRSLDSSVQTGIAATFGQNFSDVRVHADARSAQLADKLNARAFTVGTDIAFGAGEYQPGSPIGDALIAHELAHVVQQRGTGSDSAIRPSSSAREDAFETDADNAAVGAVLSVWERARDGTKRIGKNAIPALKSGLKLQRCERDRTTPQVTPVPTPPAPAPPPPPPRPLFEQFTTNAQFQAAIDRAVADMSGRIDVSLIEGGRMIYNPLLPVGEAVTSPPGDRDLLRTRRRLDPSARPNTKPYVEIAGGAFGDGEALLRGTIWHEYQHVLQMTRASGILVPGTNVRGHAQETEAYCNEIIEAESQNLHRQTLIVTQARDGSRLDMTGPQYVEQVLWSRLNSHWRQAGADLRQRLASRYLEAKAAAERMVGHTL